MSHYFFDLTHFRGCRAEIPKYFRSFFGSNKDIQKSFEILIIWPLAELMPPSPSHQDELSIPIFPFHPQIF